MTYPVLAVVSVANENVSKKFVTEYEVPPASEAVASRTISPVILHTLPAGTVKSVVNAAVFISTNKVVDNRDIAFSFKSVAMIHHPFY